jgi:hypothetical protein
LYLRVSLCAEKLASWASSEHWSLHQANKKIT